MVASAGNHITSDYSAPFRGSSQTIIAQAGNRFRAGLGTGISYGIDAAAIGGGLAVAGRNALNGVTAAETAGGKYGVAFFGESNVGYYTVENATLGRTGGSFFMMPLEDSALVTNAASAARYTGMSPSTLKAYTEGGDIFGISFPTNGMKARAPTAADAGGWPHFLEGGHTAVRLEGPNAGYLVNPTREFVIPGGNAVPNGSVMFKLGPNGEWIPMRKF
jgi:hypothetical protein